MTEFCAPRAKTYAFKDDDGQETKEVIGTKKCVIKNYLKFDDYKDSELKNKVICFKSDHHGVFTEERKKLQ